MKYRHTRYARAIVHFGDPQRSLQFQDAVLETEDPEAIDHLDRLAKDGDGSIVAVKPKRKPRSQPEPETPADEQE